MADEHRKQAAVLFAEFRTALSFLTRIPASLPKEAAAQPVDLRRAVQMFPLVGAAVGAAAGVILLLGAALGLPPLVSSVLAVATTIVLAGGLHEDGLADTADGFGGGATVARKLEIMGDSRIGTFGAIAVGLSVLLRVATLAALVPSGSLGAAAALVAAEAVSRGAMVLLWRKLPPARPGGLSDRAGPPEEKATRTAAIVSAIVVVVTVLPTFGGWATLSAVVAVVALGFACMKLIDDQIGGQTGDTLGACQQCTAIALLIAITPFA
jgi:adenosylcobinamide-GDP ribazoletransferase